MIKTLIVSGGNVQKDFLNEIYLSDKFDYIIASDRGLETIDKSNIKPNYIIGDFDSIDKKILNKYTDTDIEIKELNPEKDYTDTHMAIKLAIELNSKQIIIVGAIGTRIDHTIANIHVIKEALDNNNAECKIIDERNEIQLINKKTIIEKDKKYKYVSLIPLTTKVEGVTLKGFKYELFNETLEIGHSIGVSNEQVEKYAQIDLKKGILILIKSKD